MRLITIASKKTEYSQSLRKLSNEKHETTYVVVGHPKMFDTTLHGIKRQVCIFLSLQLSK